MWVISIENYCNLRKANSDYGLALATGNPRFIAKASDKLTQAVKHTCGLD